MRARLTAAATVIIAVGMTAAAVLLVWRVHTDLVANLDAAATQQVQSVASDAVRGQLPRPLPAPADSAAAVQVVGPDGAVITSSANLGNGTRIFTVAAQRGDPAIASVTNVRIGDGDTTYRVAALTTATPHGQVIVYAGLPTDDVSQSIAELVGALAVGLPIVILALALVGWLLVGLALRPVEAMRRQSAAIGGADLDRRLEAPAADDELGRLAATFNDLLARIEAATGRQRQFVADAAHELRSPLAALRTQLEVVVRQDDPARGGLSAADLLADTIRLSRLVDDLLALARLDANPSPPRQAVDLDDLVLEEARRVRGQGCRIDISGVSAGRLSGDPYALGRVVQNLVDNAVRYAASTVTLRLEATDTIVTLTVADDGPGVEAADRDRVFARFTRLDDARSRDAGGSGLGLAIVRDVVTAHGGQVRLDDNHPGARFTVRLPAAPP